MSKLSLEQFAAIRVSISLGRTLQTKCPEIADLYRRDFSLVQIVKMLDIQSIHRVSVSVASMSIHKAISGHRGDFGFDSYGGLIPDEERRSLGRKHMHMSGGLYGHKGGAKSYEERVGCHGVNPKTGVRYCEEGAKKGGALGGRKGGPEGGRQRTIAKGQTPWIRIRDTMDDGSICEIAEAEFAFVLSLRPEYQIGSNVACGNIAKELNRVYHNGLPIRNSNAVRNKLYKKYRTKSM